ncbi:hypothetical protein GS399_15340 [Pedobacter sp. HMF7647]|uniref:Uncharacterized protein n=1 Tax=Hufsiella arboris TaxID=2695275 RepID=A0A7K1YE91_9SPHI|nr:hypothetical protein [Hufsiella arboris]MXV52348.1 hypothetical protein [Hufsiella arboris]
MKSKNINRSLAWLFAAGSLLASCRKDMPEQPKADPYSTVKADATLRFEGGSNGSVKNGLSNQVIYHDKGALFGSSKQKFGWSTPDGKSFFFLEFEGDPAVAGAKTGATIYSRLSGAEPARVNCAKAEVIKVADGKAWILYQQAADKAEGYIVQKL